jgi:hypothetical protein
MTRVFRCDERTLAVPIDQLPVLPGLQVVMMGAESVEEVEGGEVGIGPIGPVVGLEVGLSRAAFGRAGWVEPFEGGLLIGVRASSEMGYPGYGMGPGENGSDEGVAGVDEVADRGDGDWSIPHPFAGLAGRGNTPKPGVIVDSEKELDRRAPAPAGPGRCSSGRLGRRARQGTTQAAGAAGLIGSGPGRPGRVAWPVGAGAITARVPRLGCRSGPAPAGCSGAAVVRPKRSAAVSAAPAGSSGTACACPGEFAGPIDSVAIWMRASKA